MKNIYKVWIASGVITGAGITAIDALLYEHNPLALIVTGILTGTFSGFILGSVAHSLSRSEKWFCLRIIGIAILLVVIGFILNIGYSIALSIMPHGQWQQLPSPPEKPFRFLGYSGFNYAGGVIYVETESRNIYSFTCYLGSGEPCEWEKVENLPSRQDNNIEECSNSTNESHATPLLFFKKVIDRLDVHICGPDDANHIFWIILDDGTVWFWNKSFSVFEPMFLIAASLIISLLAGIVGSLVLLIKRKKHESPTEV